MGGLNSKQISDIKKGKTDILVISNQRKDHIQKKLYTLSTTRTWDLSNNFLSSLSPKISSLSLTSLNLSSNDFELFPVPVCSLLSLTNMDLSYNFLTSIPPEIHQLSSLSSLNLSFNRITDIPHEVGSLSSLHTFKISNNYIEKIPDTLSHLHSIKTLSFSHNKISSFPKIFWPLIEEFHISSNLITSIPYPFLIQPTLRVLFISHNKLTTFPPLNSGGNPLSNIKEIYINNNLITELTTNIYFFPKLEMLDIKANNLKEVPFEMFVHSPLIRSLDISYNVTCKWGMHMPNAFAPAPLVRDIHISKNQREEMQRGILILDGMHSESDTDNEPSHRRYSPHGLSPVPSSPLVNSELPASPSPQIISSSSPSPSATSSSPSPAIPQPPSPTTPTKSSQESSYTASSSSSVPSMTPRTTTTTITSAVTSEAVVASSSMSIADNTVNNNNNSGETDVAKKKKKKKITFKQIKKYTHNKGRIRVIEHDHTIWEPAVDSHATHLADLAVWSGAPSANVTDEIKKELLQMTLIRPGYAAQDREKLHANNITHILVVGLELVPSFPTEFEYFTLSVRDNAIADDLALHFPICQKFIDTGRKKGGVLVHCAAGSSRSASCIMAYLMWSEGISFAEARKELKQLRPIVKTNFYLQLEYYEGNLKSQAKRSRTRLLHTPSLSLKPKINRSTSLPTIDALHTYKLQGSDLDSSSTANPHPPPLNFSLLSPSSKNNINNNNNNNHHNSPRESVLSPRGFIFSPRGGNVNGGRDKSSPRSDDRNHPRLQRSSHSLYSNLRVGMPENTERVETPRRVPREPTLQNIAVLPNQIPPTDAADDEIGDGVPGSVIRQASDFEQRSEIHQLMRVHSLQDLMEAENKLTKSTSSKYLKNSKINLLLESDDSVEGEQEGEKKGNDSETTTSTTRSVPEHQRSPRNALTTSGEIARIVGEGVVDSSGSEEGNIRFSPGFSDEVPAGIDELADSSELVTRYSTDRKKTSETTNLSVNGEGIMLGIRNTSEIKTYSRREVNGERKEDKGQSSDEMKTKNAVIPSIAQLQRKGLSRSAGYNDPRGFDKGFIAGYQAGFTAGIHSTDDNNNQGS